MMLAVMTCWASWAGTPPSISSGEQVYWYALKFMNGKCVLEAREDGSKVQTASPLGRDAQLWKIEGSESEGYTLTNKKGQRLYTSSTGKNGMFHAATQPQSQNVRFVWTATISTTYAGGFVLSPKSNPNVFMNQWGGGGNGKELGLWDNKADDNQPFEFVSEEELMNTSQKYPLIPYPKSVKNLKGTLAVTTLSGIICPEGPCRQYALEFSEQLKRTMGKSLPVSVGKEGQQPAIVMQVDATLKHEAYRLKVAEQEGVQIAAADSTGFFYALQTLKQLLPNAIYGDKEAKAANWTLPCVEIVDEPQLSYRGFMLDVSRHFFSKAELLRVLDVMASYKMNLLHLHLTDDQGWRVEIPEYPLLTSVGSIRAGSFTNAGGPKKFYDDTEYGRGMWYSLDDLREVVAYGKKRNIEIMPEIDLPGHMVAAIAAYPEFSCNPDKKYEVRVENGISKDVLNIGKDETIDFLKCVLGHVAEVFPYKYIHLGGDECPTDQWSTNADCKKRVQEKNLKGVEELQSWLVEELGLFLGEKYQKQIVVWDELLKHWKSDNKVEPVIMAWNNISLSATAADKGFKSILVPYQSLYLDFMQVAANQADVNEVYQGGWGPGWVSTVETVYNFNPVGALANREEFCCGVQGNLWTETCVDSVQLEYQLLPRMLALCETGWLPASMKDWAGFYNRLQSHDEILDLMGYTYAKHYFEPKKLTAAEAAVQEARSILEASVPGGVGYPAAGEYEKLQQACEAVEKNLQDTEALKALTAAIQNYKQSPIVQPQAGKIYQLVSASTYYNAKYAGSTVYVSGNNLRFHYTPQTEPEELWQFTPSGNKGYVVSNLLNGKQVVLPNTNGKDIVLEEKGTIVRVTLATKASAQYTYVPGAVNISSVASPSKLLYADCTGLVKVDENGAICYPGTWYIREVVDFTAQLAGLLKKAQHTLDTAIPGEMGAPTQEALDFLKNEIVVPAGEAVKAGNVGQEVYEKYMDLYVQFNEMPRTSPADALSETVFYRIRNAHFTDRYAAVNGNGQVIPAPLSANDKKFNWQVKKNANGTVVLTNQSNGKAAYPDAVSEGAVVMVGKPYDWTLVELTTDQGKSGLAITDASLTYSWYTNPSSWNTVIFKPKDWGASIWVFESTSIPTGIEEAVVEDEQRASVFYDLQGRRVLRPGKGIYVTGTGRKIIR